MEVVLQKWINIIDLPLMLEMWKLCTNPSTLMTVQFSSFKKTHLRGLEVSVWIQISSFSIYRDGDAGLILLILMKIVYLRVMITQQNSDEVPEQT